MARLLLDHGAVVDDVCQQSFEDWVCWMRFPRSTLAAAKAASPAGDLDFKPWTPLYASCLLGHLGLVKLLLSRGAAVNKRCGATRKTVLMAALEGGCPPEDKCELLDLLLSNGANILAESTEGYTALCAAARSGSVEATRVLLLLLDSIGQLDSSLNPSCGRHSPLHSACAGAKHDVARILLDAGAAVNLILNDGKETPMLVALRSGANAEDKLRTINLLKERGARVPSRVCRRMPPEEHLQL
jgi:ankyrin repeat protein